MPAFDKNEIARLTEEYGGTWGINHTRRLLHLVDHIGEGLQYDQDVVWLAAHLHDWGAYKPWDQDGVDHVQRSLEVVETFLTEQGFPAAVKSKVLECIREHHKGQSDMSIEAILLRDADVLDFLGVVGVLRDFSKNPGDLRKGYETTKKRRERLPKTLYLEKSKELAQARIRQMDKFLAIFEMDSFGCF
ncbi:MAG: HD domain-containing protein [Anaerolineales bacterium]